MMSAPPIYLNSHLADPQAEQNLVAIRQWERFKWLAKGLSEVVDCYSVSRLEDLFFAPPSMPGQREKVIVLLALKGTPQALSVLESLDTSGFDESFRQLYDVALRYKSLDKSLACY